MDRAQTAKFGTNMPTIELKTGKFFGFVVWNEDMMTACNMRRIMEHGCDRFALFNWN
jgi:hypothetical protein